MAEVEIQPKAPWRNVVSVTAAVGPSPPAGTMILGLDGPHELTDDDGVWVSDLNGITGFSEGNEERITVVSPTELALDDWTFPPLGGSYTGGGYCRDAREYTHRQTNTPKNAIQVSGALYYPMEYFPGTRRIANLGETTTIRMYKSTDGGTTWTIQDEAGQADGDEIGVYLDGTTIWIAYGAEGVVVGPRVWTTIKVVSFDTLTDTWGTPSPQGALNQTPGTVSIPIVMADGRVLVFHEYAELSPTSSTTDSRRPAWSVYNPGTGLWDSINNFWSFPNNTVSDVLAGSPPTVTTASDHGYLTGIRVTLAGVGGVTNINGSRTITVTGPDTFTLGGITSTGTYSGGGTTYVEAVGSGAVRIDGCVLGDSGIVHFFYGINVSESPPDRAYLLHRSFDTATLTLVGTEQVLTANTTSRFNGSSVPMIYQRLGSGQLFLAVTYQEPSSAIIKLQAIEGQSAINPLWATSDIVTRADLISDPDFAWADAVYDSANDLLWLFFSFVAGEFVEFGLDRLGIAYIRKAPGGSWDLATTWKSDGVASYADPAPAVINSSMVVVYTKIEPQELGFSKSPLQYAELFPHIDAVNPCPPAGRKRYAYFFQTR